MIKDMLKLQVLEHVYTMLVKVNGFIGKTRLGKAYDAALRKRLDEASIETKDFEVTESKLSEESLEKIRSIYINGVVLEDKNNSLKIPKEFTLLYFGKSDNVLIYAGHTDINTIKNELIFHYGDILDTQLFITPKCDKVRIGFAHCVLPDFVVNGEQVRELSISEDKEKDFLDLIKNNINTFVKHDTLMLVQGKRFDNNFSREYLNSKKLTAGWTFALFLAFFVLTHL